MTSSMRMAWAGVLSSSNKTKGSKRCMGCLCMFWVKANRLAVGVRPCLSQCARPHLFTGRLWIGIGRIGVVHGPIWGAFVTAVVFSWFKAFGDEVAAGVDAPIQFQRGGIGIEFASAQMPVTGVYGAFQVGGGLLKPRVVSTGPIVCGLVAWGVDKQRVFTHFDV